MPETREGRVEAIGASIHYKVSGRGPTLLLLPDGDGDAEACDALAEQLAGFTVVTYDRRGTPRSPIDDPREPVTLATHADDAARVLIAVTTHAARAFGAGRGAGQRREEDQGSQAPHSSSSTSAAARWPERTAPSM